MSVPIEPFLKREIAEKQLSDIDNLAKQLQESLQIKNTNIQSEVREYEVFGLSIALGVLYNVLANIIYDCTKLVSCGAENWSYGMFILLSATVVATLYLLYFLYTRFFRKKKHLKSYEELLTELSVLCESIKKKRQSLHRE